MHDRNNTIEFLYQSISDIQQTIRALDIKAGFVFLILFAPLPIAHDVYKHAVFDCQKSTFGLILVLGATITWVIAIFFQFLTLSAVVNPQERILNSSGAKGAFFGSGLFSFNFIEAFFGTKVKSSRSLDNEFDTLPASDEQILRELTYERMKLSFILTIKAARSRYSMVFTGVWLFVSLALCILDGWN